MTKTHLEACGKNSERVKIFSRNDQFPDKEIHQRDVPNSADDGGQEKVIPEDSTTLGPGEKSIVPDGQDVPEGNIITSTRLLYFFI